MLLSVSLLLAGLFSGPADPHEVLLERSRTAAQAFMRKVPDFVCQQVTTRYWSNSGGRSWKKHDVISAEVVVEGGKESYRNVTVNKKPVTGMEQVRGMTSTGEFASLLRRVFESSTQARFTYEGDEQVANLPVVVYHFEVDAAHSTWRIRQNEILTPPLAYAGTVWIDQETAGVLRLKTNVRETPKEIQLENRPMTTDYEYVSIGGQRYLLPARSENMGCGRDGKSCMRNTIEFRNCHKYTSESTIIFEK